MSAERDSDTPDIFGELDLFKREVEEKFYNIQEDIHSMNGNIQLILSNFSSGSGNLSNPSFQRAAEDVTLIRSSHDQLPTGITSSGTIPGSIGTPISMSQSQPAVDAQPDIRAHSINNMEYLQDINRHRRDDIGTNDAGMNNNDYILDDNILTQRNRNIANNGEYVKIYNRVYSSHTKRLSDYLNEYHSRNSMNDNTDYNDYNNNDLYADDEIIFSFDDIYNGGSDNFKVNNPMNNANKNVVIIIEDTIPPSNFVHDNHDNDNIDNFINEIITPGGYMCLAPRDMSNSNKDSCVEVINYNNTQVSGDLIIIMFKPEKRSKLFNEPQLVLLIKVFDPGIYMFIFFLHMMFSSYTFFMGRIM